MTNESRRAFDAEWQKYTPEDDKPYSKIIATHFWQASEARILALLESDEMVFILIDTITKAREAYLSGDASFNNISLNYGLTKEAIKAIKQRINKGENNGQA